MNQSVIRVSVEQSKRCIALCMKANIVPMLISPPGAGKTTAVVDFVNSLKNAGVNADLRIMILSQCDISDFSLPKEIDGRVVQCPAQWLPLGEDEGEDDPYTFIMFDEIDRASPDLQNLSLNILLGRNIAGKALSSKVVFVCAGNGSSDIFTTALSKAMINRLAMVYIGSSFDSYEKWANDNGISQARIAFQKFRGEELIDHKDEFEDISFPTNRSLDAVDAIDRLIENGQVKFDTTDIIRAVTAGLIGVPAEIEYRSFKKLFKDLPSPDEVLANPTGFDSSNLESSVLYAFINNIVRYASTDVDKCEACLQFLATVAPEFRKAGASSLIQKNPEAVMCKSYSKTQI